ncbi:AMIN domain-containing protein [Microcoleus sp. bin38.metabat.b11b12b14.051]|uniref:AMIN domain-containing protein n=1 Tax=Microcoleus sp. bin38.metabat.b11b12b14.051 TaxID=2742709 RepID=UPI0025FC242A|nr:AMIN domain-containing protein [Microcoleus sp. bin38.metabat.b11b12b14.051]
MPYKKLPPKFWPPLQILPLLLGSVSISLSIATTAAIAAAPSPQQQANASTATTSWQFDPVTNQLQITLPFGSTPTYSLLNPSQIAVDLPNTELGVDATQLYPQGSVRSVGASQLRPGTARILVNLAPGIAFNGEQIQFQKVGPQNRWVLRPSLEPASRAALSETPPQPGMQVSQNQPPTDASSTTAPQPDRADVVPPSNSPTNSAQTPAENDQIRPLTVPLVSVPLNERRGVRAAAVTRLAPQNTETAAPEQRTLTFGEPLPDDRPNSRNQAVRGANLLLAAGEKLSLLYPGDRPLRLEGKPSRQEVLLLQGGILDSRGNTIVPANTPVIGRFETTNLGSRFVVEAISLNGRNIPVSAGSQPLGGRRPEPRDRSVFRNSGIGGLALFLLSGFSGIGLLAGAAAGVATSYAAAPQPATIQPGQIFQVELTEDVGF